MAEQKDLTSSELAGLMRSLKELSKTVAAAKAEIAPSPPPPAPEAPVEASANAPGYGLPPIYANRFNLWANDQICRFIIGDSISGNDLHYKMSFVMTRDDAREFIRVTKDLLDNTEPVLK